MTKSQQTKLNMIRRNIGIYCYDPVFSTEVILTEEITESGNILFQVTNPDAPWYETHLSITGWITPRGRIKVVGAAEYAAQLTGVE